jgi:hypothetical protein
MLNDDGDVNKQTMMMLLVLLMMLMMAISLIVLICDCTICLQATEFC